MVPMDKCVGKTRFLRWLASAMSTLAMLVCWGCGESGPERFDVKGKVTLDGSSLSAGQIIFEPDSMAGNRGPAGYAEIVNGEYDTARGKGTVGGPHVVRVRGQSGTNLRINNYETKVDLGKQSTTKDFDVPRDKAEQFNPSNETPA